MIIYIDENMPPNLAVGLNTLQIPLNYKMGVNIEVKSIRTIFGAGTKDEDWIPIAGKEDACIITQDFNIQRLRHQKVLYEENKLGMFFLRPPSKKKGLSYWEMVELCVDRWMQILDIAHNEDRPFSYRCSSKRPFEKL
jgi:hypothetical protein